MAASVEQRFGSEARHSPGALQWFSETGPPYIAQDTRQFGPDLGLRACTTSPYSLESNGIGESFVKTFKRDDVYVNKLNDAATVIADLKRWFENCNELHPHSGLKMKAPERLSAETCPIWRGQRNAGVVGTL